MTNGKKTHYKVTPKMFSYGNVLSFLPCWIKEKVGSFPFAKPFPWRDWLLTVPFSDGW